MTSDVTLDGNKVIVTGDATFENKVDTKGAATFENNVVFKGKATFEDHVVIETGDLSARVISLFGKDWMGSPNTIVVKAETLVFQNPTMDQADNTKSVALFHAAGDKLVINRNGSYGGGVEIEGQVNFPDKIVCTGEIIVKLPQGSSTPVSKFLRIKNDTILVEVGGPMKVEPLDLVAEIGALRSALAQVGDTKTLSDDTKSLREDIEQLTKTLHDEVEQLKKKSVFHDKVSLTQGAFSRGDIELVPESDESGAIRLANDKITVTTPEVKIIGGKKMVDSHALDLVAEVKALRQEVNELRRALNNLKRK